MGGKKLAQRKAAQWKVGGVVEPEEIGNVIASIRSRFLATLRSSSGVDDFSCSVPPTPGSRPRRVSPGLPADTSASFHLPDQLLLTSDTRSRTTHSTTFPTTILAVYSCRSHHTDNDSKKSLHSAASSIRNRRTSSKAQICRRSSAQEYDCSTRIHAEQLPGCYVLEGPRVSQFLNSSRRHRFDEYEIDEGRAEFSSLETDVRQIGWNRDDEERWNGSSDAEFEGRKKFHDDVCRSPDNSSVDSGRCEADSIQLEAEEVIKTDSK